MAAGPQARAARNIIEARDGEIDEVAVAAKLVAQARRRYAKLDPRKQQQRLYALLVRRVAPRSSGTLARNDWRRSHVDALVERIYANLHATTPWVRFGVSPFGIGRPELRPPGIQGFSQYHKLYADVERWLQQGWMDYLVPQATEMPDEIIVPKMPENPPRSLTWNHAEFTLTMATAAKL